MKYDLTKFILSEWGAVDNGGGYDACKNVTVHKLPLQDTSTKTKHSRILT